MLLAPFVVWLIQVQVSFQPSLHMCCLVSFALLLNSSCHCSILVVVVWFLLLLLIILVLPSHLFCVGLGVRNLDPPSSCFFQVRMSNCACNFLSLFFWMLMFIFPIILVKHSFMLQVQSLFVIKLGNILTLENMFVVCRIFFFFFALHCITFHFAYSFFT
jgi:hypothetical protein